MLIALDIGNSSISAGFFTKAGLFVRKIDTYPLLSPLRYSIIFNRFIKEINIDKRPEGIIISSVVPVHTEVLIRAMKKLKAGEPLLVNHKIKTGLAFNIPRPEELGSDRIANAVAAFEHAKGPAAAVDFGTATTISVVGKDAGYSGGAIMPGIRLMSESLAKGASQLNEVRISIPGAALGTDTATCVQSGLLYGTAGAVERLLSEFEKETGVKLKIMVTGGYGNLISNFIKRKHTLLPNLTLEGLKLIYTRNLNA